MNIFEFLFYLGIIHIIFGFIWKWALLLPALLLALVNFPDGIKIVKIFGSYLLVSLTALLTLIILNDNPSWFSIIFYPLLGAFVLWMSYISNQYEARKEASMNMDWKMLDELDKNSGFEIFLSLGAVILYIIILFIPSIAINSLNQWLFEVISWIFELPVIGWIIGFFGVLFLINIIFHGIFAAGMIISSIINKFKKKENDNNFVIAEKPKDEGEK